MDLEDMPAGDSAEDNHSVVQGVAKAVSHTALLFMQMKNIAGY